MLAMAAVGVVLPVYVVVFFGPALVAGNCMLHGSHVSLRKEEVRVFFVSVFLLYWLRWGWDDI